MFRPYAGKITVCGDRAPVILNSFSGSIVRPQPTNPARHNPTVVRCTLTDHKSGTIVEYRDYGTTGQKLSIIAFAGIVVKEETTADSARYVSWAIDQGINYFDVAPGYGNAQNMLGPALEQYRNDVFLACKTKYRTGSEARADLENSLKLLRTDHFDLYQMYAMTTEEDLEVAT